MIFKVQTVMGFSKSRAIDSVNQVRRRLTGNQFSEKIFSSQNRSTHFKNSNLYRLSEFRAINLTNKVRRRLTGDQYQINILNIFLLSTLFTSLLGNCEAGVGPLIIYKNS